MNNYKFVLTQHVIVVKKSTDHHFEPGIVAQVQARRTVDEDKRYYYVEGKSSKNPDKQVLQWVVESELTELPNE